MSMPLGASTRTRTRNQIPKGYQYEVPAATGFTIRMRGEVDVLLINPATFLASGTVYLPDNPIDGEEVTISTSLCIQSVTIASGGASVVNPPLILLPGAENRFKYARQPNSWFLISGLPNGRAWSDSVSLVSSATISGMISGVEYEFDFHPFTYNAGGTTSQQINLQPKNLNGTNKTNSYWGQAMPSNGSIVHQNSHALPIAIPMAGAITAAVFVSSLWMWFKSNMDPTNGIIDYAVDWGPEEGFISTGDGAPMGGFSLTASAGTFSYTYNVSARQR